jgi:serine/threonine-protein kinase
VNAPVQPGDLLGGKFRVERVLGQGGMGVVVVAMHMQLEQRVALKFLLPEALEHPEAVARFAREAKAAARIQSEHVARVIDVSTLDTGAPYIVMEYLDGQDLAATVDKRGRLPIADIAFYMLEALEALAEAHVAGIVHRDIKPANLFLSRRVDGSEMIKVLDFGISKLLSQTGSEPDPGITRTASMLGSPIYMSPEQLRATKNVDARADLWSIGVILYELLCGTPPFSAETLPQLIAFILYEPYRSPETIRPDLPPALVAVVKKCLEKDPAHRYGSALELAQALAPFAPPRAHSLLERIQRMQGSSAMTKRGLPDDADLVPALSANKADLAWGGTRNGTNKRSTIVAIVAAAVVAAAAGGAFLLLRGRAHEEPRAPEQAALPSPSVVAAPSPSPAVIPAPPPTVMAPPVVSAAVASLEPATSAAPVASTAPSARAPVVHAPTPHPMKMPSPKPPAEPADDRAGFGSRR